MTAFGHDQPFSMPRILSFERLEPRARQTVNEVIRKIPASSASSCNKQI